MTSSANSSAVILEAMDQSTVGSVHQQIIVRYFETFNQALFEETAGLFAQEGQIQPPFDAAVKGPAAIAQYLEREAKGMVAEPMEIHFIQPENLPPEHSRPTHYRVKGKVQNSLFSVHVAWDFEFTKSAQISQVKVRLLASLQELFKIQR